MIKILLCLLGFFFVHLSDCWEACWLHGCEQPLKHSGFGLLDFFVWVLFCGFWFFFAINYLPFQWQILIVQKEKQPRQVFKTTYGLDCIICIIKKHCLGHCLFAALPPLLRQVLKDPS